MPCDNKIINGIKKLPSPVCVGIIILFAVIRLCIIFSQRDGHHVDETWSYGFANSYEYAQVYDGYEDNSEGNLRTWITGYMLNDYVSVSEEHRFSFAEVLRNSHYDLSPPLYILILHFVCSLFPGSFSWAYAFSISIFCFIPSLILIYFIAVEFTKSKFCGFFSMIYYIFSGCGTANFIFLRVYFLLTVLSLFLFWLIVRVLKNDSKRRWLPYCLLPVATILGSLTHYYFLVLAFFLTLFAAFLLLIKKRVKAFFGFGFTMLGSVMLFFVIYPSALKRLLPYSSGGNATTSATGYFSYPYHMNLTVANLRFFLGSIGWFINFNVSDLMLFCGAIVLISIIIMLILFLFRNENWMKDFISKCKSLILIIYSALKKYIFLFDSSVWIALLSTVAYLLVIPYSASLVNMGNTERYFFPAMTLFIIVYICFVGLAIKSLICSKHKMVYKVLITTVVFVALLFLVNRSNLLTNDFKFRYSNEHTLIREAEESDCYVVGCFKRDLTWLSADLNNSKNIFFSYQNDFSEDGFTVPDLKSGSLVLVVESGLMTNEQKEDLISEASFSVDGFYKPEAFLTLDDIILKIQNDTGYSCVRIDECPTHIGMVGVYRLE